MSSWMDWILAVEPQIPGNLKIRRHSEVPIRKRKLGVAERKGFRETFGDFKPVSPEKLFPKPSSRDRLYKASQALLVSVEEKPFDPIRVIDLPVSAYAAFRKSPEHYRKVYEIGYSGEGASETDQWTQDPEPVVSAADFGQAMHKFFERMDFQSDVPVTEDLFQECFQMGTGPSDLSPRADEGRRMLEEFYQTSLFRELRNAKVIHREIPFLLNERHGLIQGVLDVLFQDQKGKWHILDYKTGEGQTEKVKKEGTELQIQLYAHALYQITGIVPVSGILHFLRNNWTYRLVFNQESIQRIERQVKGIQEEILSKP